MGQLFQPSIEAGPDGSLVEQGALVMPESTTHTIGVQHITHFNVLQLPGAAEAALWHNHVQKLAEGSGHGIPVTISTDPRHSQVENVATALRSGAFSAWPEALGLAALRDPGAVHEFADIARREYLAVGIRAALHPQVDLATEPRWARQSATFGADAGLTIDYLRAYLEGFQGEALGPDSVACVTKHFPGGGPQKDGEDPHFPYGREQIYPGGKFDLHLEPFRAAVEAGTAAIMPYYGMPVGLVYRGHEIEEVGFGYNKQVITGILRDEFGYDGAVVTDWQLVSDVLIGGQHLPARAWGVERLDRPTRIRKILDAGCDQLGGETCTDVLLDLVRGGQVPEERLDESLTRLLTVKFELGLFDNPYVDVDHAAESVGTPEAVRAGMEAQTASVVILRRPEAHTWPRMVYVEGMEPEAFDGLAAVVDDPADADAAIVRLAAPFEPRSDFALEPFFHAGSLEFSDDVVSRLADLSAQAPLIVDVTLD
ncbi:glycoside hydrolase family 3 N-terminal domain-containing protein [Nonomuraea sp. NPDC049158]|uniref:glycoside hydrolase family 3 protein n=1 Tax=Nonomuraea sp. NPDC049158 TaxID=3155649 RepID=UPI0033FC5DA8